MLSEKLIVEHTLYEAGAYIKGVNNVFSNQLRSSELTETWIRPHKLYKAIYDFYSVFLVCCCDELNAAAVLL